MRLLFLSFAAALLSLPQSNNSGQQIYSETPGGQVDGINTTFVLQNVPSSVQSVMLFKDGMRQKPGVDYFVSGNIITFVTAATPMPGDSLLADYVIGNYLPLNAAANAITKNLIPDSDLKLTNTYWAGTPLQVAHGIAADGGNAFVYIGTGTNSSWLFSKSYPIPVIPGVTYTLSGYIDETAVVGGNYPLWGVYNYNGTSSLAVVYGPMGGKGRFSASFMVPPGNTQVVVICDTNNTLVSNGGQLIFSNPQLELGSQVTAYKPNLLDDLTGYVPGAAIGGSSNSTRFVRRAANYWHMIEKLGLKLQPR